MASARRVSEKYNSGATPSTCESTPCKHACSPLPHLASRSVKPCASTGHRWSGLSGPPARCSAARHCSSSTPAGLTRAAGLSTTFSSCNQGVAVRISSSGYKHLKRASVQLRVEQRQQFVKRNQQVLCSNRQTNARKCQLPADGHIIHIKIFTDILHAPELPGM